MRINRLALLTFAAMSLSTAAFADGRGFLKSADINKDGAIDQSEFQTTRDKWFADLDADKDGFVTADELKAFGEKMHAEWAKKHADAAQQGDAATTPPADSGHGDRMAQHILKRVDADKDGKISRAEFDTESAALFKRLDKDADGKVAGDEMPTHRWRQVGARMFDRIDQDQDGKVTKAEFTAAGDQMFLKMDVNGDGVISKDEMRMHKHGHDGQPGPDGTPAREQAPTP